MGGRPERRRCNAQRDPANLKPRRPSAGALCGLANALHLPSTLGSLCGSRNQIEGANLNPTRLVSQHFTWLIGIKNMNQSSARETFRETGIDTGLKSVLRFIPPSDVI